VGDHLTLTLTLSLTLNLTLTLFLTLNLTLDVTVIGLGGLPRFCPITLPQKQKLRLYILHRTRVTTVQIFTTTGRGFFFEFLQKNPVKH